MNGLLLKKISSNKLVLDIAIEDDNDYVYGNDDNDVDDDHKIIVIIMMILMKL